MDARRRRRDERGAMAIEFLLVVVTLMVIFLIMLQYALRAHAHRVAEAAAEEAIATATAYHGTAASGQVAANDLLHDLGSDLRHPTVIVTRNSARATATVKGDVQPFIPFLSVHVAVHLEAPVERFVGAP